MLLMGAGCASHSQTLEEVRTHYVNEEFEKADLALEASPLREQERNRLLYLLEKASITDKLSKRQESRKLLKDADALVTKLFTTSVSKEALTYVYNDSAQNYSGEDYEKVAIHSLMALSFLQDRELPSARVEARRINTRLDEINSKYDEKNANQYREDAFALYLSGAIFEANGEADSAIIDYRKSLKVYEELYSKKFSVDVPTQLVESLARLLHLRSRNDDLKKLKAEYKSLKDADHSLGAKQGEVLFLFERGVISPKFAKEFFLPVGSQVVRVSYPSIDPKRQPSSVSIKTSRNTPALKAELLQNFDSIAAHTLDDSRTRMMLKQGARLLIKGQLAEQARQNFGALAGIAANVVSAVTETADTRSWMLLSSAIYGLRTVVPAGTQQFDLQVGRIDYGKVTAEVKPGKLSIIRITPEDLSQADEAEE
jgi:hypothetical protein